MDRPLISVLMPVYNAARYLEEAMDSILRQTYTWFELIAIDDGSTDASLQILHKFAQKDSRIKIISRPNTGIVGALNHGLDVAKGEYIARMDADDVSLPERFSKQLMMMESHPDLVALGTAFIYIDNRSARLKWNPRESGHEEIESSLLSGDGGAIIHPSVMMRTKAVRAVGGYREKAQWLEDLDLYLRLARVGRLSNLKEALLLYRYHLNSVNFTKNDGRLQRKIEILREAYKERGSLFNSDHLKLSAYPDTITAAVVADFAITSLVFDNRWTPLRYAFKSLVLNFGNKQSWKVLSYVIKKLAFRLFSTHRVSH